VHVAETAAQSEQRHLDSPSSQQATHGLSFQVKLSVVRNSPGLVPCWLHPQDSSYGDHEQSAEHQFGYKEKPKRELIIENSPVSPAFESSTLYLVTGSEFSTYKAVINDLYQSSVFLQCQATLC